MPNINELISNLALSIEKLEGILVGDTSRPDKPAILERLRNVDKFIRKCKEKDLFKALDDFKKYMEGVNERRKEHKALKNKLILILLAAIVTLIINLVVTFGERVSAFLERAGL